MGDSVMTVIAIFLAAILMFIFPLMSTADRSDDIAQQVAQSAVTDAVDKIRTTGTLKLDDYEALYDQLIATGNAFEVEITAMRLDENSSKKTTQASSTKVGENYTYTEYTTQIVNQLETKGIYTLKEGDIITVTVRNTNKTISQIIKNFMFRVTGNGNYVILAQDSGIVNVTGKAE